MQQPIGITNCKPDIEQLHKLCVFSKLLRPFTYFYVTMAYITWRKWINLPGSINLDSSQSSVFLIVPPEMKNCWCSNVSTSLSC